MYAKQKKIIYSLSIVSLLTPFHRSSFAPELCHHGSAGILRCVTLCVLSVHVCLLGVSRLSKTPTFFPNESLYSRHCSSPPFLLHSFFLSLSPCVCIISRCYHTVVIHLRRERIPRVLFLQCFSENVHAGVESTVFPLLSSFFPIFIS